MFIPPFIEINKAGAVQRRAPAHVDYTAYSVVLTNKNAQAGEKVKIAGPNLVPEAISPKGAFFVLFAMIPVFSYEKFRIYINI
jgi:hypothetical protein